MLVLLYYLSQNADFAESVKPIMSKLKDSEQMLHFLNDLSKFTQTFSTFQSSTQDGCKEKEPPREHKKEQEKKHDEKEEKTPRSPTAGIADEFIQQILDSYLKKN